MSAGLSEDLNAIGFNLVGYGCTTCIGNSGPLDPKFSAAIAEHDLVAASVLSGNRNFEGRVSPDCRANYLASPPLVVAYALAGTVVNDMNKSPLGQDKQGVDVFLKDVWPTNDEVRALIDAHVHSDMFRSRYADVYHGDDMWRDIAVTGGDTYKWPAASTYIQNPPYFEGHDDDPQAADRYQRRAGAGAVRRFDHHRPHFAGRGDQARQPGGRATSAITRCRAPNSTAMARGAATTR